MSWPRRCSLSSRSSRSVPVICAAAVLPSQLRTTWSPMSTAVNAARERVDVQQVVELVLRERRDLALRAAARVASSRSARSSLRVISTMNPSPMRVGSSLPPAAPCLQSDARPAGSRRPGPIVSAGARLRTSVAVDPSRTRDNLKQGEGPTLTTQSSDSLSSSARRCSRRPRRRRRAAPARAASPDDEMRQAVIVLRGLIDRSGAAQLTYPQPTSVRAGHLGGCGGPDDPRTAPT